MSTQSQLALSIDVKNDKTCPLVDGKDEGKRKGGGMNYKLILAGILLLSGCEQFKKLRDGGSSDVSGVVVPPSVAPVMVQKILVAMGQSNIVGRGQAVEFPNNSNVTLTRDIRTGPAYYAAAQLAIANPTWHITLVQCAEGGTDINRWIPGGDRYDRCVEETKAAKETTGGDIIGVLFYQGEANARDWGNFDPLWPNKLEALIYDFRNVLGLPSLPVIWAELGTLAMSDAETHTVWTEFKRNQLKVSLMNATMIKTDDQPVVDDVHHGYGANVVIGERFYRALSLSMVQP